MTRHYPDLGSASDGSRRVRNLFQPIRSTTQILVVTRHRYGIPAIVSQTSFVGKPQILRLDAGLPPQVYVLVMNEN